MKKIFILAATATLLFSCKKSNDKSGTFTGPQVEVQHGKGWSYIKLDGNGDPQQFGVTINDAAMNSMPVGSGETGEGHHHEANVIFPLNPVAKATTPFDHVEVDWNPYGHEPTGIYDLPHFDFHFYMITEAEVKAAVDAVKLNAGPSQEYLPQNYVPGVVVPQMGKHWIDVTSPEFHGQTFTETFIFGTYNSNVTFYEPMITLNFLKATTLYERPIPQPAKFKQAGWYPTKMRIIKHDGVTDVVLDGFIKRNAS
jgi:hypothetical protein